MKRSVSSLFHKKRRCKSKGVRTKQFQIKFLGGDLDGRTFSYPVPKKGKNKVVINKSWWVCGLPPKEYTECCQYYIAKVWKVVKEGDIIEYQHDPSRDCMMNQHGGYLKQFKL